MRSFCIRSLSIVLLVFFGAIATGISSHAQAAPNAAPAAITRDPLSDKFCTVSGTRAYRVDLRLPEVLTMKIIGSSESFQAQEIFYRGCITISEKSKLDHLMNEDYWGHLEVILSGSGYFFSAYSLDQALDVFRFSLQNFLLGLYPPSHPKDGTYLGMDIKLTGFASPSSENYVLILPGVVRLSTQSSPKCPQAHKAALNRRCS